MTLMRRAAEAAGRSLARDFGEVAALQVSRKGPGDFVSAADLRSEEIIRDVLLAGRPGYKSLMEESGGECPQAGERAWVVDPLDGTANFLHGLAHFSVSIALVEGDQLLAGIVHHPATGEFFTAERGRGAFCNGRRLRVAARSRADEFLLAASLPLAGEPLRPTAFRQLARILPDAPRLRLFGSAALELAWVADGRLDGFWQNGLKPWDWAAGALLIQEAGGFISELGGRGLSLGCSSFIAGNEAVHRWLQEALAPPAAV